MRIALDARKLRDGGIGTYIRGLLGALAETPRGHEFVALLDPADLGSVRWPAGPVAEVPVRAAKYGLSEHWRVPRAARAAGATLLHAPHYTLPLGWTAPAVVTIHDLIHIRFARFHPPGAAHYARAVAGAAARRARLVLADSRATRDDILELLGIADEKVRVIPLGVSPALSRRGPAEVDAFLAAHRLPRGYLLYVGARKRHKNLETLLAALARLAPAARPPLVLSGSPWAVTHPLARLAARLGLAGGIRFTGSLGGEHELACLYSGAALYAQPSLAEGFGLPPLEAMACGTPVLASTAGALPEVTGGAALLLPPADAAAWASAIAALGVDPAQREAMIRAGRARAAEFTWQRTAALTLDAYEEAARRA